MSALSELPSLQGLKGGGGGNLSNPVIRGQIRSRGQIRQIQGYTSGGYEKSDQQGGTKGQTYEALVLDICIPYDLPSFMKYYIYRLKFFITFHLHVRQKKLLCFNAEI